MAKFAIVGLLSLAALLLSVSAQSGQDILTTLSDDSDLNAETSTSGDGHDGDDVIVENLDFPLISEDTNWESQICTRYRSGTQAIFF